MSLSEFQIKDFQKKRAISFSLRVLCSIWQTSHRYLNQKQKFKINTSKLIKSKNFLKKFSKLIIIRCVSTFTVILSLCKMLSYLSSRFLSSGHSEDDEEDLSSELDIDSPIQAELEQVQILLSLLSFLYFTKLLS